jgi:hypothetical protein
MKRTAVSSRPLGQLECYRGWLVMVSPTIPGIDQPHARLVVTDRQIGVLAGRAQTGTGACHREPGLLFKSGIKVA